MYLTLHHRSYSAHFHSTNFLKKIQALEEEFARQRSEQERFYGGNYTGANGDGDNKSSINYPTASLQRSKKGSADPNRHSTIM